MRLKSLKLRRAEVADRQISDAIRPAKSAGFDEHAGDGPAGRVRHDERGVAVWDWAVASGEFATLSTTRALKKLEQVADLQIEDHKPAPLRLETTGRDKAGGFDPYNQRGTGKRQGEAAQRVGVTGLGGPRPRLRARSAHGQEEVRIIWPRPPSSAIP